MELKFLNKLDSAIFKHLNPKHQPVTGTTFVHALIGGTIISLIVFVMQMCVSNKTVIEVVAAIGLLALVGWVIRYAMPALRAFTGWGGRILYGAYVLFLAYAAFMIAMWMVMIALLLVFLYIIFKVFFSSSSKKSDTRIIYGDGTEVKAKKTGRGICGETYYEGENGDRVVEP